MEEPNIKKDIFSHLCALDVDKFIQTKPTGFRADYISWCTAWTLVKEAYPDAVMSIGEDPRTGLPYFEGIQGIQIRASITIQGIEQIAWFPVKNSNNKAIPKKMVTETDIHNATQRAIVKCLAWHGFGIKLWIKDEEMLNKIAEDVREKSNQSVSVDKPNKAEIETKVEEHILAALTPREEWDKIETNWNDKERSYFHARLGDMSILYTDLKNKLYEKGFLKPSSMSTKRRVILLELLSEEGLSVVERLTPLAAK